MDYKDMTVEELEERRAAIPAELDKPDADLDALEAEARGIKEELEARKAAEAQRNEIRAQVAGSDKEGKKVIMEERNEKTLEQVVESREYLDAYVNYLKTGKDGECRALLTNLTATTTGVPVPTYVDGRVRTAWQKNEIMDMVRKTYVPGILKVGFERSADPAYIHTEGAAADTEEALQLGVVTLTPASIKKWIDREAA